MFSPNCTNLTVCLMATVQQRELLPNCEVPFFTCEVRDMYKLMKLFLPARKYFGSRLQNVKDRIQKN